MPEHILLETRNNVGYITLNRPEALNALNYQTMIEVVEAAQAYDQDPEIKAIVIAGSERAFAAGADIKEMAERSAMDMYTSNWFSEWDELTRVRIPIIAAVSGYALGGGCELALMCDIIIAAESAKFGQPEINLGILPGMGGSQRLARAVGKAKAMDMCLTGRHIGAEEAERIGLVSRVVPTADLLAQATQLAEEIATKSRVATVMNKEAVNVAFETTLRQGLDYERRLFYSAFASEDQSEGMEAFAEKRSPEFKDR